MFHDTALVDRVQPARGDKLSILDIKARDDQGRLVNFDRQPADLSSPLDSWLYFLNNGVSSDADALSPPLDRPELQQAMEILRIQLCERLLARPMTATTELLRHSTPALRELADALEQELLRV